ncbi:hypothetical protein Cgig2_014938 [Carnegiea gigantea]|uniref:TOD1/MUCI70 glycosyltransferase-like domain-containing protein n=1 Tax=Carnegiea gigantea TaxID=171969 RepID=A0A9Q1Q7Z7_9CARY|nr:hypothetical protein Cgig2_014938 [Carnegiea gigantea]
MAQYRQSGFDRVGGRSHDSSANNHHQYGNGSAGGLDHVAIGVRASPPHKQPRHHRRSKGGGRRFSIGTIVSFLCFVLAATAFAFLFLSRDHTGTNTSNVQDDDFRNDFLTNVTRITTSQVSFGHGSTAHGRDSRYWDGDDRRRDEDYNEDVVYKSNTSKADEFGKGHVPNRGKNRPKKSSGNMIRGTNHHGLYNEAGRNELKMYEEKYEASLKNIGQSGSEIKERNLNTDSEEIDIDDEYDDGIDSHDARTNDYDDARHEHEVNSELTESQSGDGGNNDKARYIPKVLVEDSSEDSSAKVHINDNIDGKHKEASDSNGQSKSSSDKQSKKRGKHHKFSAAKCEMKLLNSTAQLVEPLESREFARFSLSYTEKETKPDGIDHWEPRFAGHQSLREREESFMARDQQINCGFVKGPEGYSSTGFDLAEDDSRYISTCHTAVVSCIFGNSDRLRSPFSKTVSRLSRKNVCFVMFMDEETLQTLSSEGQMPDKTGFIGLWRVVVVKNLPYSDMRRVGKIPKLLSHRLFPSARYSIWLDSKLRLQRDPLLLLEYFLWRKGHEYAISNHYDRHCVWEEVERNKKLNKYNHTMIDQQFAFYQADGLKRFNASDPDKLLPSNVPEGSLIVRAHTPMSNLFSCLWFNEVDRFTPRDQLSFAYTYHKLSKKNPDKPFYLHMFKDCERRQIAKLFRHRAEEKRTVPQTAAE